LPAELDLSMHVDETFELVTEPDRLLPHRVWVRRETRTEVTLRGMRRSETKVEETEHRYRY
jgi:hypothetical protein